jgi:hypothetical protein
MNLFYFPLYRNILSEYHKHMGRLKKNSQFIIIGISELVSEVPASGILRWPQLKKNKWFAVFHLAQLMNSAGKHLQKI